MSSINTKRLLAKSLKKLTESKSLKRITVVEICEEANLNRHTFYYHFEDKQDLVNWIYKDEIINKLSTVKENSHWSQGTLIILKGLQESKEFYINALKTEGQNSFEESLFQETFKNFVDVINNILGKDEISSDKLDFMARFYAYSFTYMSIEWILKGMEISSEELTNKFVMITENSLEELVKDRRCKK